ncbi:hypothetical protein [Mumia zhuanghuii]|uniref:hypothetical protein n=1 Tax=Mumia zhuanghuii TaxID=2585211 RepID=UPI0018919F0E|nr:hypothetical protein [Mumia zhuanghuii]
MPGQDARDERRRLDLRVGVVGIHRLREVIADQGGAEEELVEPRGAAVQRDAQQRLSAPHRHEAAHPERMAERPQLEVAGDDEPGAAGGLPRLPRRRGCELLAPYLSDDGASKRRVNLTTILLPEPDDG